MDMSGHRIVILENCDTPLKNIEQHFKIIAGPGAGKTRWLCNHIKNVLNKSERLKKTRKVACITYTNIGVDTILKKIGDSIDKVEVSTIHSFLYKNIVKPYIFLLKDDFGFDPSKINGHDELTPSKGFVLRWLEKTKQAYPDYKEKSEQIIQLLCDICWKFPEDDSKLDLQFRHNWRKKIGKYSIKKDSLIEYKKMFWERNLLHHDDILYFSLELIRKYPDILRVIRCKFPYFFIDEFQDTNPIQTKIIKMVAEQETIVGVIGDKAQSIYGFQGANVKQFEKFELPNLVTYKIENNYRSTEEILKVLNHIRKDITQHNPFGNKGEKPKIFTGSAIKNYNKIKQNLDSNNTCTLSYTNLTSCEMKNEYFGLGKEDIFIKLKAFDSTKKRGDKIASLIKGVEYARQNKFKDAIKEVSRYFKSEDIYKGQKISLILIKEMLDYYEEYCNGSLYDIYDSLNKKGLIELMKIPKINVSRKTMINEFYQKTKYKDIILCMKYYDDNSLHRTIHKAKGDEFDNVFVILPDKADWVSNEEEMLSFLLNPDLNKEEHRVYYVALSRARKRLFVNIPKLSTTHQEKLKEIGFNIEKY
jgi:DNA helicase II / ATP-dependent DNA helicase PcrA